MCGFGGIIDLKNTLNVPSLLDTLGNALSHRGPDDEGKLILKNVGLVHRRLSIIDVTERSSQPMTSADKRFTLLYNGEIYNFAEIRSELRSLGVEFNSNGDTEVLLRSLIKWGVEAIPKLNGMFSFAFFDSLTNRLILARDRYGIKPLYYYHGNDLFVFASEEKAINKLPFFDKQLDLLALSEYLTFQNVFSNRTFFVGIHSLNPGSYMEIDISLNSIGMMQTRYWDFKFEEEMLTSDLREQLEELERLFSQAIERCLVSDVAIGQYLSSGIDTALIATETSKRMSSIPTFTIGFDFANSSGMEVGFDERQEARELSKFLNTSHTEYVLAPGDMQSSLRDLTFCLDTPRVGQSYPNFFAAKLASERVKVVLSGTGSDEIFAGYPWRYFDNHKSLDAKMSASMHYRYWQRLIADEDKPNLLKPIWKQVRDYSTQDLFAGIVSSHTADPHRRYSNFNNSLYLEAKTFLVGLLNIEDKIHMNFGIENRVPFLDNELVDFAMKCSPLLKMQFDSNGTVKLDENIPGDKKKILGFSNSGKFILQEMYKSRLPHFSGHKQKKGFSGPDASWFKGPSLNYAKSTLLDQDNRVYDYLEFSAVVSQIERHFSGNENRRLLIWSLLTLSNWLEINL